MVNVQEAQRRLPELLDEVAAGKEVVIARPDGTAVRLTLLEPDRRPRFGSARGMFTMSEDFDEPLEDFAPYER